MPPAICGTKAGSGTLDAAARTAAMEAKTELAHTQKHLHLFLDRASFEFGMHIHFEPFTPLRQGKALDATTPVAPNF